MTAHQLRTATLRTELRSRPRDFAGSERDPTSLSGASEEKVGRSRCFNPVTDLLTYQRDVWERSISAFFRAPHEIWSGDRPLGVNRSEPIPFICLSPSFALKNLFSVTIGNMVGGALVGVTYWLIYLRKRRPR